MTQLTTRHPNAILVPANGSKDARSRLRAYAAYLNGAPWWRPDLAGYAAQRRADGLAESSIAAHLASIRSRYRDLLRDRDLLYSLVPPGVATAADRKAVVDELAARIENALDPKEAPTFPVTHQDRTDRQQTRLTVAQASALIATPRQVHGPRHPAALRDGAVLALMLCTGVRESELVALDVDDLRQYVDGELCLLIRHGKGNKQRAVPYGDLLLGLELTERWLRAFDIRQGAVFRAFTGRGYRHLAGRLSKRRVSEIVRAYRVERDGEWVTVAPHDLRRTYARRQYDAGMDIYPLSLNMGHTSIDMTMRYVGDVGFRDRRNRDVFSVEW